MGGNPDVTPYLVGAPLALDPNEAGWRLRVMLPFRTFRPVSREDAKPNMR
jgi:hypothetical protein